MSTYSDILEIPAELLENLATAFDGYGKILQLQQREENSMSRRERREFTIANCFHVAALYKAVVKPKASLPFFRAAAEAYWKFGNPFWKMLAVCGRDLDLLSREDKEVFGSRDFFYEWLRRYYLVASGSENRALDELMGTLDSAELRQFAARPVGSLGIPMEVYFSIVRRIGQLAGTSGRGNESTASSSELEEEGQGLSGDLSFLLKNNEARVRFLQSDSFHWTNGIGIIPFETEVLAFCICIVMHLAQYNLLAFFQNRILTGDQSQLIPFRIAVEINASKGGGEGGRRLNSSDRW